MEKRHLPPILKIEKAKNEVRFFMNQIAINYDLDGYMIDLILDSILSEERKQRLSLISEQITLEEVKTDGKHSEFPE